MGLTLGRDDDASLANVIILLESANEDMGFRYFTMKSGGEAALNWTREVIEKLMPVVTALVDSRPTPSSGLKVTWEVEKPKPK